MRTGKREGHLFQSELGIGPVVVGVVGADAEGYGAGLGDGEDGIAEGAGSEGDDVGLEGQVVEGGTELGVEEDDLEGEMTSKEEDLPREGYSNKGERNGEKERTERGTPYRREYFYVIGSSRLENVRERKTGKGTNLAGDDEEEGIPVGVVVLHDLGRGGLVGILPEDGVGPVGEGL